MNHRLAEVAGWCGATAIVAAYALVSFHVLAIDSYLFQLLNLAGAIGLIIISATKRVGQSVVVNVFWALIALVALAKIALQS